MELALETRLREYLLGLSGPDSGTEVEIGILQGTIDVDQIRLIEDELIDDFVFGALSPRDQRAFLAHFLCSEDRKQRLALARQLVRCARSYRSPNPRPQPTKTHPRFWSQYFVWRWTAIAAMGCSVLLTVLLRNQRARTIHETEAVRIAQNEADRLRTAMAQTRSIPPQVANSIPATPQTNNQIVQLAAPVPSLELHPDLIRGIYALPVLRRSPTSELIWIRLQLPEPPKFPFREELIAGTGTRLWMQQFESPNGRSSPRSDLSIPASLLPPGDYLIRLEEASAQGAFEETATYAFRVAAN